MLTVFKHFAHHINCELCQIGQIYEIHNSNTSLTSCLVGMQGPRFPSFYVNEIQQVTLKLVMYLSVKLASTFSAGIVWTPLSVM